MLIMKLVLDRISINKHKLSKNPLEKLYYYYRLSKISSVMEKLIKESKKFDFDLLIDYLGVCKFLNYTGFKNSSMEDYIVKIVEEEGFATFADIIIRSFEYAIQLRIKLQKPQEIQLDYSDLKLNKTYRYELTKEDISLGKITKNNTEKTQILNRANSILKKNMIDSVKRIMKEDIK